MGGGGSVFLLQVTKIANEGGRGGCAPMVPPINLSVVYILTFAKPNISLDEYMNQKSWVL